MCIETQPTIEGIGIIFIDRGRYFFFKKSTNLSKLHVICIMRNRATFNMPTPPPLPPSYTPTLPSLTLYRL